MTNPTRCIPKTYDCNCKSWCVQYLTVATSKTEVHDYSSDSGIRCKHRMSVDHHPTIPIRLASDVEAEINGETV